MSFLSAPHQGESLPHSPRIPRPSCFQLMKNIKELHFSYFSVPHSFCPATYSAPIDFCSSINIAEPFMVVPHHFFHWKKELLSQHIVCNNCHWYTPIWRAAAEVSYLGILYKFVHRMGEVQMCTAWNNSFLALLLTEKRIAGHCFLATLYKISNSKTNCCNLTNSESSEVFAVVYLRILFLGDIVSVSSPRRKESLTNYTANTYQKYSRHVITNTFFVSFCIDCILMQHCGVLPVRQ